MIRRLLLTLPLLLLAHCTSTNGTHHAAIPPPAPAPVEVQQQTPSRPPEEQLEFFNQALDQA